MFNEAPFIQPVGVREFSTGTGTWTFPINSGVQCASKAAAAETTTVYIPISPARRSDLAGVRINQIDVPIRVATDSLTAPATATLFRINDGPVNAAGAASVVATEIATTNNIASLSGVNANDRLLTVTVTSPNFDFSVDDGLTYALNLTFATAATTVLRAYPAKVSFVGLS